MSSLAERGGDAPSQCRGVSSPDCVRLDGTLQETAMLDAAFIRDNADAVRANCVNRNVSTVAVEEQTPTSDRRPANSRAAQVPLTIRLPRLLMSWSQII